MPFSGLATYDDSTIIGEDVSDILRLISPVETPLLDLLPQPDTPVTNTYHQWTEEELGPDNITVAGAAGTPGDWLEPGTDHINITANVLGQLQPGMLLDPDNGEIMRISSLHKDGADNNVYVARGYGGSAASSLSPGAEVLVLSTAELEGSETSGDVTRPRTRRFNYTQIFKKAITISGTRQAVVTAPAIGSEYNHQTVNRATELARDLEKAVIRGIVGPTGAAPQYGSDTDVRTMRGLRSYIEAINSTMVRSSFAANPIDYMNDILQACWNSGARDLNTLLVGSQWKREISSTNASQLQVRQDERGIDREVTFVNTDYYTPMQVVLTPWMPPRALLAIATGRIMVKPLRGRSFQYEELAKTGDSTKGHVIGEYTVEIHHPHRMGQLRAAAA